MKPTPDTVPNKQAAQANTFKDFILFTSLERLCLIHMIQLISPIIMARIIRHKSCKDTPLSVGTA